jgi:hypothetical protein
MIIKYVAVVLTTPKTTLLSIVKQSAAVNFAVLAFASSANLSSSLLSFDSSGQVLWSL